MRCAVSEKRKTPESPVLKARARQMRAESTDAEKRIWFYLRARKLAGFKFRRQAVVAGFITDFYCDQVKLVIELDGGQHLDEMGLKYDEGRTEALNSLGVRVIRFSDIDALKNTDGVVQAIYDEVCKLSGDAPSP